MSEHILDYEKAGDNVYTRSQARRLDIYLHRKSRQAAGSIGIIDTKKAVAVFSAAVDAFAATDYSRRKRRDISYSFV